ncbi:MAG: M48 family metallopeptidase [Magnetococcales bacterium]|nr:M48 family metallopeptidase [Magnetococcales bacterium]MBF0348479.1 M48 family metallopeptidase [Magnetococcales bacterium]MBF0632504.1 M48 family metallopeptidase [Magnetococcales bacterium]
MPMDRVIHQRRIVISGREECIRVAFVKNRKRISILVDDAGGIQVRCPSGIPLKQVDALLVREKEWLNNRLSNVRLHSHHRQQLGEGTPLPFLGDCLTLRLGHWGRGTVFRCGDDLWITRIILDDLNHELDIRRPLERWYQRGARAYFAQRLDYWARKMGVSFNQLHVRGQKTRWGSCSCRGNINLNWRLMWAAPRVVDYVVVHELSHLSHMDHSAAFWERVGRFVPDYLECRKRLKAIRSPW